MFTSLHAKSVLILLSLCLALPVSSSAASAGKVAKVNGTVFFRERNNIPYAPLTANKEINEGNWLKTGKDGWIELTLADQSKFTIANNSELEITRLLIGKHKREGTFNLTQGKLRATVVKLAGKQAAYNVKSGTAVAGIKGTEFLMLSQGPANVFFGNEGTVSVSGNTGEAKPLGPGTMTQNTRGFTPVEPVKVEPGTPLAQAKAAFDTATAPTPPSEWLDADTLPGIIARWNINYGHYLADSGKFDQALHVFQIALDLTDQAEIRADARLERGAVYSRFLANPEAALAEYLLVLEEYPKSPEAETALFSSGQILYEMKFNDQAIQRLNEYLKQYPEGKHRSNVETLLNLLGK